MEWQYRIKDAEHADLELIVKEVHPLLLDRLFQTAFSQWMAGTVPWLIFSAPLLIVVYSFQRQPDDIWAFAGRHVGSFVDWALFVLFAFILPSRLGLTRRFSLRNSFFR